MVVKLMDKMLARKLEAARQIAVIVIKREGDYIGVLLPNCMSFEFQGRCYSSVGDFMHGEVWSIENEGKRSRCGTCIGANITTAH